MVLQTVFKRRPLGSCCRYEEPGGAKIVTHPRNIEGTIRKEDDRRKRKRQEKAERVEQEEKQRREEIKRLKNLKKAEINEKLGQVRSGCRPRPTSTDCCCARTL